MDKYETQWVIFWPTAETFKTNRTSEKNKYGEVLNFREEREEKLSDDDLAKV